MAFLSRLRLTNFRNLADLDLDLPEGVSVYFGPNAQGKTSLLEAVYLLAIARSFRAGNEREVVNFQAAGEGGMALVDAIVENAGERSRVIVGYQSTPARAGAMPDHAGRGEGVAKRRGYGVRKEIRINRTRRTAAELVGLVTAVLFSALDIDLVFGPPSLRRRFLDILLSQADPQYLKTLQRYLRVVQQRNRLLRMLREGRAGRDELDFWDDGLVREGSWLTWRRHELMQQLSPAWVRHHLDLVGPGEELTVEYRPSVPLSETADGMEASYRQSLVPVRERERMLAATAAGPHRDDFALMIDGVDMAAFASRGQARTLALALRLAEAEVLSSLRGEGPLVLLDDALSEMDRSRRRRVLEKTGQYRQVLITTTDAEQVSGFYGDTAAYYEVSNGRVVHCDYRGLSPLPLGEG